MGRETLDTIRSLLESVLEETDDEEVHYKLRTAMQLLAVRESEVTRLVDAAEHDDDLAERLEDLGYL